MALIELAIFIVTLIFLVLFYIKRSQTYWARRNAPHLEPVSFWGNMGNPLSSKNGLKTDLKKAYYELKKRGMKHGGIYLFTQAAYLLADPETIKTIFTRDFQYFNSRGVPISEDVDPLTGHLFNVGGERWKKMRVKLTPTFTSGKVKMMFDALLKCGGPMLERIGDLSRRGESLDVKEILSCYTTDIIGSCVFGLECNSFKDPDAEFRTYGRKFFTPRFRLLMTQFLSFSFPEVMKKFRIKIFSRDIEAFFIKAIGNVIDYRTAKQIKRNDFIQILLDAQEKSRERGEEVFNKVQLAAQSFVFFSAGFEPTSAAMTFCLHELAFNQDVQDKLRTEIKETLKKNDGKFTYEGVMEMKYLDQVFSETLRKYPPASFLFRKCNADYKLPDTNATMEVGTLVFVSISGLHYDEKYYPDPEKFLPERFTEENKARRPQCTYLPFGDGPRFCIGARFGLMQAKTGLSMILNEYRIVPAEGQTYKFEYHQKTMVTMKKDKLLLNAEKL